MRLPALNSGLLLLSAANKAFWCSYERERLPRVQTIHAKGHDQATAEDRERYIYKPTFRPLWRPEVTPGTLICLANTRPVR